jgi:hypothetical protein
MTMAARMRVAGPGRQLRRGADRPGACSRPPVAPAGLPTAVGVLCPPRKRGPRAVAGVVATNIKRVVHPKYGEPGTCLA